MSRELILSAAAFAATDVDDLVVLTALFALARGGRGPGVGQIVVGQYLGIGTLVAASALAAFGLLLVPDDLTRFLGLVPLGLGVAGLVRLWRAEPDADAPPVLPARTGALGVAGITVANGGDNIAVYVPFFTSAGAGAMAVIVAVFAVLTAVWCATAYALGSRPATVRTIDRWGHVIVPLVFIGLGAAILAGL